MRVETLGATAGGSGFNGRAEVVHKDVEIDFRP